MQNVPKPVCLTPHAWSTPASGPSISSTMKIASLTSHLAIALVVLTACSSSEAEWADGSVPVHEQYRAPDSVQRIEWSTVSGYEGTAHDFIVRGAGDTVIVLDPRAAEIAILARSAPADSGGAVSWQLVEHFGRTGDGPGEFRRLTALASASDGSIWTWSESARLQRFALDGSLLEEARITPPCSFFRSSMASLDDVLYVGGQCAGGGAPSDTVYARVYRVWPDTAGTEIASAPVATMDFSFGSLFAASRFVTEGNSSVVFMSGIDSCITRIPAGSDSAPVQAVRTCVPPPALYRSEEPAFLKDLNMPGGARPRWPDPITPLFAQVDGNVPVIVQVVSEDSLALTRWAPGEIPFLFAPVASFVGCRNDFCLWFDSSESRLALLRPAELVHNSLPAGTVAMDSTTHEMPVSRAAAP